MISEETKIRLRELEGQRITLEDELDRLAYTNNFARIAELEGELMGADRKINSETFLFIIYIVYHLE